MNNRTIADAALEAATLPAVTPETVTGLIAAALADRLDRMPSDGPATPEELAAIVADWALPAHQRMILQQAAADTAAAAANLNAAAQRALAMARTSLRISDTGIATARRGPVPPTVYLLDTGLGEPTICATAELAQAMGTEAYPHRVRDTLAWVERDGAWKLTDGDWYIRYSILPRPVHGAPTDTAPATTWTNPTDGTVYDLTRDMIDCDGDRWVYTHTDSVPFAALASRGIPAPDRSNARPISDVIARFGPLTPALTGPERAARHEAVADIQDDTPALRPAAGTQDADTTGNETTA